MLKFQLNALTALKVAQNPRMGIGPRSDGEEVRYRMKHVIWTFGGIQISKHEDHLLP